MPNPAVDFAQLSLEHVWNGAVTIEVVSTTGAIMRTLAAEKQTDNWQFRLDVKDLPAGTYIAKVLTGDTLYVGKIMKR
ncbi:MAG: T9SS type A sorting domain-containing protein [Lewinellaceae bacterium]|nr:T9SS type A sorting domain-containing protein [Lewinellaceae bacterium]